MKRRFRYGYLALLLLGVILCLPQTMAADITEPAHSQWFPFAIPWDDATANVTDVSKLVLEAPAGKHGFLQVKNGHFFFEDGTRVRFWGANLSAEGNFPPHETAEKLAAHLGKFGFNMIRLHHMDSSYAPTGIFDKTNNDTMTLSLEQLDRLDYLIYQLKLRGIYVDINLHVGRKFTASDGVIEARNLPRNSKQVTLFNRKLIELQKSYARKLLMHVNPYTKTKYSEEPSVALVETTNENTLFTAWANGALFGKTDEALPLYYLTELDQKWNDWLRRKYGDDDRLKQAWQEGETVKGSNLLKNPGFESSLGETWVVEQHQGIKASVLLDAAEKAGGLKAVRLDIVQDSDKAFQLQLKQLGVKLKQGKIYTLSFKAKAERNKEISLTFGMDKEPWTNYGLSGTVFLSNSWEEYQSVFTATASTDNVTRLSFSLGKGSGKVWLDEVELAETGFTGLEKDESMTKGNIERTKWPERFAYTEQRVADNVEFYYTLEKTYFHEMLDYLHNQLGIKVPVSTSNNYYGQPDLMAQNEGDYIDAHGYWDHPGFPGPKRFDPKVFTQNNKSLIRNDNYTFKQGTAYNNSPILRYAMSAVAGKPLVISEWNDVFPNDYDYELAGVIAAYGLLQDWDGLFIYTLCHRQSDLTTNSINSWFNVINNPGKMAQMPAFALAFIRGDFKPAAKEVILNYATVDLLKEYRASAGNMDYGIDGLPTVLAYSHKVRKGYFTAALTSKAEDLLPAAEISRLNTEKIHASDTGEIHWNLEENDGEYITFNTVKSQGAVGFIGGKALSLGNLNLNLITDGSVLLTATDNQELGNSTKMLLTLVARQQNSGQLKDAKNGLKDWGKGPVLLQAVSGRIEIKVNGEYSWYQIYALDGLGNRVKEIKNEGEASLLRFQVGTDNTPWYEIVREM